MPSFVPGDADEWPTTIQVPVNGDTAAASSVATGLEQLADRTANLNARIPVALSNATPAALGVAAPGVDTFASRSDHVHAAPTAESLGLGGAALLNVGTTAGTVAAGDDARLSDDRTANAARETSGPTLLTIGAVGDGEYLRRVGSTVVGGSGGDLSLASSFVIGGVADAVMPPLGTYSVTSGTGALADVLRITPIAIGAIRTLTGLALGVAGTVANAVLRMGLYECGPDGYPTALLFDSGTLDASASTRLLAQPVSPMSLSAAKKYAVAYLGGVASPNLRLVLPTNRIASAVSINASGVVAFGHQLATAQAFGALPATAPSGMVIQAGTTMPCVCIVGTP